MFACVAYGSEKFQNVQRYDELLSMLGNVKFILIRLSISENAFEVYDTFPVLVFNPIWAEMMSEADRLCVGCRVMHLFSLRVVEFAGMKSPIGRNRMRMKETGKTSESESITE